VANGLSHLQQLIKEWPNHGIDERPGKEQAIRSTNSLGATKFILSTSLSKANLACCTVRLQTFSEPDDTQGKRIHTSKNFSASDRSNSTQVTSWDRK
jgi:hypothetical protein